MSISQIGHLTGFVALEDPSDKFGAPTYSCKIAFEGAAADKMKIDIDKVMAESKAKSLSPTNAEPPYKMDGKKLVVSFKRKAEITAKTGVVYTFTVKLFDCKGAPITDKVHIGSGSKVRVNYQPYLWNVQSQGGAGCTLQLDHAQIIDLVAYEGGSGGGNPFDEVDGYPIVKADSNPFTEESSAVKSAIEVDIDF